MARSTAKYYSAGFLICEELTEVQLWHFVEEPGHCCAVDEFEE